MSDTLRARVERALADCRRYAWTLSAVERDAALAVVASVERALLCPRCLADPCCWPCEVCGEPKERT